MSTKDLEGKNILVCGLGKSGKAAMEALVNAGSKVWVYDAKSRDSIDDVTREYIDKNSIQGFFGEEPDGIFDYAVLSPGISPETSYVKKLEEKGAEITGELELAYNMGNGTYIAITGTNGKTTTTTLTGEIFKASGRKTYVVGNIGVAVVSKSVEAEEDSWLVTETSSFQLETVKNFRPAVSAILNLTPDHLNRHKTMENYGLAKANIFKNQDESDYLVINYDDKLCWSLKEGCRACVIAFSRKEKPDTGAFISEDKIMIREPQGRLVEICSLSDIKIIGDHNIENVLAAAAICYFAGISPEVIKKAVSEFRGVEHRIEYCCEKGGVKFYNDSKGTNTDAAITALKALKANIILLAGGDAKEQDFAPLAAEFKGRVKHLVLYGRDRDSIRAACDDIGYTDVTSVENLPEALEAAYKVAEKGDNILLSPACASWDMYRNFEERGAHFKELAAKLED